MRQQEKFDLYFNWLLGIVCNSVQSRKYEKVLRVLFNTPFRSMEYMSMDDNRIEDGLNLRRYFKDETHITLLDTECSVLELMIALAQRCEHDIMYDDSIGDRSTLWFWKMFDNLGLNKDMTERQVFDVLDIFIHRNYSKNGSGGLFKTDDPNIDMRELEIWAQMNVYLNTIV